MSKTSNDTIINPVNPDHVAESPGLMEYAHHVGSALIQPDDPDLLKNNAVLALLEQTDIQLEQIKEQIDLLARQANEIVERRKVSLSIYSADLKFKPVIGQTYFFYRLVNDKYILSMIAPDEWGKKGMPYEAYIYQVKLRGDHTWEIVDFKNSFNRKDLKI